MYRKGLRVEAELKMKFLKIFRNRVMDSYFDCEVDDLEFQKIIGKERVFKMELSFSLKILFV